MRRLISGFVCTALASGIILCGEASAQRYVNNAQEAAKAAQNSLKKQRSQSSSQIEWLNSVVNTINMRDPSENDIAAQNNKAIEEGRGG
jgi:hypothetical protein